MNAENLIADFTTHAEDNYASGHRSAVRDVDQLQNIADKIADFLAAIEPQFAKLDIARDVLGQRGGIRVTSRSNWDRECIIEKLVEAFASELLSDRANMVLHAMVNEKMGVCAPAQQRVA